MMEMVLVARRMRDSEIGSGVWASAGRERGIPAGSGIEHGGWLEAIVCVGTCRGRVSRVGSCCGCRCGCCFGFDLDFGFDWDLDCSRGDGLVGFGNGYD